MKSLFTLLSQVFPPAFRGRFGAEIVERALGDLENAREKGSWAGIVGAVATTADLIRAGLSERVQPTWVAAPEETHLSKGWGMMMGEWLKELRFAGRSLMRSPGFFLATVGTLTLALGVNVAIFSVVNAVLIDPLPFESPEELVYIGASAPGTDMPEEFGVSYEFFLQYSEESDQLEKLSWYNSFTSTLRVGDQVERVRMTAPTWTLFDVLGVEPMMGRLPTEDDENVMLISHSTWVNWFGSDPTVVGKAYSAGGDLLTVIGVMPPEFQFPADNTFLWIPQSVSPEVSEPGRFGMALVGRLAEGADEASLSRELSTLASRLPELYGGSPRYARVIEHHVPVIRPIKEQLFGSISGALWVMFGAVLGVLLIACANVANLFSVRAEGRARDLAVRRALGAGRGSLIRAQVSESLIVAMVAGVAAVGLAAAVLPTFVGAVADDLPRDAGITYSGTTMIFTVVATAVSALLSGLLPALRASNPALSRLRDGGRGSTRRHKWGRSALVVGQTALALVLLIGSGLLLRSFTALRDVDPGYDTEDVFTFQFAPEQAHLTDGPTWAQFHMDFVRRIEALPGVEAVGIIENVPLDEGVGTGAFFTEATVGDPNAGRRVSRTFAGADYFSTMRIEVVDGRGFTDEDLITPARVVISKSTAESLFPGERAVGQRLQPDFMEEWFTVIGVVEDVMQYDYRSAGQPMAYFPLVGPEPDAWRLTSPGYVIRTSRAETIAPEVRALVREVAPEAPMYRTYTMAGLEARSMARLSLTMTTLAISAGLALLLGAIGLYGILSYVVAERTQEIGVRMALGAGATAVRRMVVAQGTRVVAGGIVLGIGVSLLATRALGTLLFGVEAIDMSTLIGTALTMLVVGVLASYLPARRASSVDPIESMRTS
jgi:putative ABC transport system permease protein